MPRRAPRSGRAGALPAPRRHGEAGTVHHAADIAVQLDVGEVVFARFDFGRVFLGLVAQRLDTEARNRVRHAGDDRTHAQACAALLSGLLLGSPDDATGANGVRTVIGITVPVTTILGTSDAPGELADRSATVPADVVRDKALEPGTLFHRLLTDEHAHLLDVTHLGRFAPESIRTALWFRDGTTTFPTSTVAADRCDVDHVTAWPAPTRGDNLAPVHRQAHRLKTAGHYTVRRRGRGWEWTTGTGHTYRRDPDPLPGEPLPVEVWPAA